MQDIVLKISLALKVPTIDVYFIAILLVLFIIFCILWIQKIYEVLFWLVLWIAIFIVFQYLLLNPNLTVPDFINVKISKFIVWSSIYLIFILSILVPLNWWLHISEPRNPLWKILQTVLLSAWLLIFYMAIISWFVEKTYIYTLDNALSFIKKLSFWSEFSSSSLMYWYLKKYIPHITLFSVLFVIYRVTFNDVVNMVLKMIFDSLWKMMKSLQASMKKWWGGWGGWDHWDDDHWGH